MIEKRPFGRTGHDSSATLFGAAALAGASQDQADQVLELLLEHGVNHIDTAASYGDAELRIGPWMARHRQDFFLATKTGERTYEAARTQIRASLQRLEVDQIDLIQLHNLVHPDEWATALGAGGALEAALEARQEGLVRFIGVTGHGLAAPAMHRRALERFSFDSVLFPFNYILQATSQYAADSAALMEVCRHRGVAMQTIKSIALGPWGKQDRHHTTWYEPLEEQGDIDLAVAHVLSEPDVFLNTAGDMDLLPRVLAAAAAFSSQTAGEGEPEDAAMKEMADRARMSRIFA